MILRIFDGFKVRKVERFNGYNLTLKYDSFGSPFSFSFFFESDNPEHKELACVTHFHQVEIEHNNEILVTGFALSQGFTYDSKKNLATISGYSKPGWFEDCSIPPDLYPLQHDGVSLLNIAKKLTSHWNETTKYNIGIVVDPEVSDLVNKSYKTTTASETDTIAQYLTKLAQQKKVIISHDNKGNLLFTQAKTDKPPILSFDFSKGMISGTKFVHNFNGQNVHSHITAMKQASVGGGNAGQETIKNPYCPVVYRPKVVTQSSGDDIDTKEFLLRELAKEWENLTLSIEVSNWRTVENSLILPNNIIEIIAPELYIYDKHLYFIREVIYVKDPERETCTLNCCIPEVVNGKMAKSIFEGINMHP